MVPQITYTEDVKSLAETYGAYWLLNQIVSPQLDTKELRREEFQVWRLDVRGDGTGLLTVEDHNKHVIYTCEVPFTGFPKQGIKLWMVDQVIMLRSEH